MKFFHLADLHIGKSVCERSMLDEQRVILGKILDAVESETPDAVLIAGDVYDKTVPSAESVAVLDDFLVALSARNTRTFVLSGNHDSAERIAFGGRLMKQSGVHVSPVYSGEFVPVTLKDCLGEIDVWMLPFVRPATVRSFLSTDEERDSVTDYTTAVKMAVSRMKFTEGRRNILLAHQYVTGATRSDSEESVGGLDNVDASVFEGFDYVALGHIHGPQNVLKDADGIVRARYCGTPLKYSLSEAKHEKSITVVELGSATQGEKGLAELTLRTIPLIPEHDVFEIEGLFAELVSPEFRAGMLAQGKRLEDFIYAVLKDENDVPDAAAKLRGIYPNLMMLMYDNARTRSQNFLNNTIRTEEKSPAVLFGEFFKDMTHREMNGEEQEFVEEIISGIWEEKK